MTKQLLLGAAMLASVIASPAAGDGLLDFADPCKDAEKQFSSTTGALRARADAIISTWDKLTTPPKEIRELYVVAVKEAIYSSWLNSPEVAPLIDSIRKTKPDFDSKTFFFETIYPKAITPEAESKIVDEAFQEDYKANLRPNFVAERKALEDTIGEKKKELDAECKPDLFSQVIRSTLGRAILIVNANLDAAKNERGEIAKLVRATSGISITDIEKNGLLGGENSELRKVQKAITGGENSEVNKALRATDQFLNPTKWKIEVPPIKLPDLPLPQLPPLQPPKLPSIKF